MLKLSSKIQQTGINSNLSFLFSVPKSFYILRYLINHYEIVKSNVKGISG
jgi:hypothetical protein